MSHRYRFVLAAVLLTLAACAPEGGGEDRGEPVAVLDGREIREGDLDEWIREDLYRAALGDKDPATVQQFRQEALERMVTEQLLTTEAEKRGLTLDELQGQVVAGVSASDEEVREFYEGNRARIGDATYEQLAERIRTFLGQQKQAETWSNFLGELRENADFTVLMEPHRSDVAASGPGLGPEDAPITIVEFSDFNCPYCQRVMPTLKALRERYPDQVRIVFRHFPLESIHPRARPIAEASVCADEQGQFWAFHDHVFASGEPLEDDAIRAAASKLGLDLAAFDACLADGRAGAVVAEDVRDASAVGVTGTPAFFVNGILLSGAQPLDAFVRVIESEIARTGPDEKATPSS